MNNLVHPSCREGIWAIWALIINEWSWFLCTTLTVHNIIVIGNYQVLEAVQPPKTYLSAHIYVEVIKFVTRARDFNNQCSIYMITHSIAISAHVGLMKEAELDNQLCTSNYRIGFHRREYLDFFCPVSWNSTTRILPYSSAGLLASLTLPHGISIT